MKTEIQRVCHVCNIKTDRKNLIKITKLSDDSLAINPTSKELGRSIYVCKNKECIKKFIKKKKLKVILKAKEEEIKKIETILGNFIQS